MTWRHATVGVGLAAAVMLMAHGCAHKKNKVAKNPDGTVPVTDMPVERSSEFVGEALQNNTAEDDPAPEPTGIRILSNTNGVYSWVDANGNINISRSAPPRPATRRVTPAPRVQPRATSRRENGASAPAPGVRPRVRAAMQPPVVLSARVDTVVSGDRVRVQGREMRLLGVEAPRVYEKGGPESLQYHRTLIEGKHVNIVLPPGASVEDGEVPDAAFVFLDRMTFVNAELIRNGYARAASQPQTQEYRTLFVRLEERARAHHRGMWR